MSCPQPENETKFDVRNRNSVKAKGYLKFVLFKVLTSIIK